MHTAALARSHGSLATDGSSMKAVWLGRAVSALPILFLTVDTAIKVLQLPVAVEATQQLGFTASAVFTIGVIEAVCLVLYLVPEHPWWVRCSGPGTSAEPSRRTSALAARC
jgi:hypothetical protein